MNALGASCPDVTDRHEVSRRSSTDRSDPTFQLLEEIEETPDVSQRSMALSLGIALGLTNSMVRGLIRRGWVRAINIKPHRVRYLITPAGIAEKARLSQAAFRNSVERFRLARARVQGTFAAVSRDWPEGATSKAVVFYGSGEVAEIGYICLQQTDLRLVGVIDDQGRGDFFGVTVYSTSGMPAALVGEAADAKIIVMSLAQTEKIRADLAALDVHGDQAIWV